MFTSKKKILSLVSKKKNWKARHRKKILNEVKNTENIFTTYMI